MWKITAVKGRKATPAMEQELILCFNKNNKKIIIKRFSAKIEYRALDPQLDMLIYGVTSSQALSSITIRSGGEDCTNLKNYMDELWFQLR